MNQDPFLVYSVQILKQQQIIENNTYLNICEEKIAKFKHYSCRDLVSINPSLPNCLICCYIKGLTTYLLRGVMLRSHQAWPKDFQLSFTKAYPNIMSQRKLINQTNSKDFPEYCKEHSSEKRGLRLTFCTGETLQNLPYL